MMKLIREFDDFNWVREIDPEVYFTDVKVNRFYGVKILNGLLEVMKDCEVEERVPDFLRAEKVFVNSSGYYTHNDIWCDSDIYDKVLTLRLDFFGFNGEFIGSWWVTDEMVKLFLLEPNELNESKDEWGWVRDEPLRPTYEFPPKKGDVLICLPGFDHTDDEKFGGGSGYEEGRIIVVGDVTDDFKDGLIIWPDVKLSKQYWDQYMGCFDCGIWDRALAYYNK